MSGYLEHPPCRIVRQLLLDLGLVTEPILYADWPVFVTEEPQGPDNVVTLYDTPGIMQGRFQVDGEVQEEYGIQIRVRSQDYETGYTKAKTLANALDEDVLRESVTVDNTEYLVHAASRTSGGILALGRDEANAHRRLFTINYLFAVTQEP